MPPSACQVAPTSSSPLCNCLAMFNILCSIISDNPRIGCIGVRISCAAIFMNSFCIRSRSFNCSLVTPMSLFDSCNSLVLFFTSFPRLEFQSNRNIIKIALAPVGAAKNNANLSLSLERIGSICEYIVAVGVTDSRKYVGLPETWCNERRMVQTNQQISPGAPKKTRLPPCLRSNAGKRTPFVF